MKKILFIALLLLFFPGSHIHAIGKWANYGISALPLPVSIALAYAADDKEAAIPLVIAGVATSTLLKIIFSYFSPEYRFKKYSLTLDELKKSPLTTKKMNKENEESILTEANCYGMGCKGEKIPLMEAALQLHYNERQLIKCRKEFLKALMDVTADDTLEPLLREALQQVHEGLAIIFHNKQYIQADKNLWAEALTKDWFNCGGRGQKAISLIEKELATEKNNEVFGMMEAASHQGLIWGRTDMYVTAI